MKSDLQALPSLWNDLDQFCKKGSFLDFEKD